jgi:hypothetical protein
MDRSQSLRSYMGVCVFGPIQGLFENSGLV